jgi:hypothetical protein
VTATLDLVREKKERDDHVRIGLVLDGDVARLLSTGAAVLGTREGVRARGRIATKGSATMVLRDGAVRDSRRLHPRCGRRRHRRDGAEWTHAARIRESEDRRRGRSGSPES